MECFVNGKVYCCFGIIAVQFASCLTIYRIYSVLDMKIQINKTKYFYLVNMGLFCTTKKHFKLL
jgi:hypothetical protein